MSNLFARFRKLIPSPQLQVGDVLDTDGSIAAIELPGGGLVTARGSASTGDRVFVRDGVIEGSAPTLPVEVIEE